MAFLISWKLVPTFSRYVENLRDTFTLSTSKFYLAPLLNSDELTISWPDGYTEGIDFTVANYIDSKITAADISYTVVLTEDRETPLFDLYFDNGSGGKTACPDNTISGTLTGGAAHNNIHTLYLKVKNSSAPADVYPVNITLTSLEPYMRSYSFTINVRVPVSGTKYISFAINSATTDSFANPIKQLDIVSENTFANLYSQRPMLVVLTWGDGVEINTADYMVKKYKSNVVNTDSIVNSASGSRTFTLYIEQAANVHIIFYKNAGGSQTINAQAYIYSPGNEEILHQSYSG
jgi:hypothetical protein